MILMVELETKKLLKIFGVTVTDFEDESNRIIRSAQQLATSATSDGAKKFAELARDALELISDMNAKWFEVTNYLQAQQKRMYEELVQVGQKLLPPAVARPGAS